MADVEKILWQREKVRKGIDPRFSVFIVVAVILMAIYVSYLDVNNKRGVQFDAFSKGFSIISFILVVYVIFINVEHNAKIEEQTNRQQTFNISKDLYINLVNKLSHNYPETYFLDNEIQQFDERTTEELEKIIKYDPNKRKMLEDFYCSALIQQLEDFLTLKKYLVVNQFSWIKTFYYQYYSKILQKRWNELKDTYSPSTNKIIQQFIDIKNKADKEGWSDEKVNEAILDIDFSQTERN